MVFQALTVQDTNRVWHTFGALAGVRPELA